MRILVDLASHLTAPPAGVGTPLITEVEQDPPPGGRTAINGRYSIPTPAGATFPVDINSYVLDGLGNNDGGDVVSQAFAHLLATYPMYGNIYYNPLLTAADVSELDLTAVFNDPADPSLYYPTRVQTGRAPGSIGSQAGCMPTHTGILPANLAVSPPRPGMLVTDEIDISGYTFDADMVDVGADGFMVYWKLYGFSVTEDVAADHGALAGQNEPAIRYLEEVDQEPPGFRVYLSPDNGVNWCEVGLLEPLALALRTKSIRLAFRNDDDGAKRYLAQFAFLF
jgi:hypothetical protein